MNGVRLRRYYEDHLLAYIIEHQFDIDDPATPFDKGIKKMYKSYIALENTFRALYSSAVSRRISRLYGWLASLDEM